MGNDKDMDMDKNIDKRIDELMPSKMPNIKRESCKKMIEDEGGR